MVVLAVQARCIDLWTSEFGKLFRSSSRPKNRVFLLSLLPCTSIQKKSLFITVPILSIWGETVWGVDCFCTFFIVTLCFLKHSLL